MDAPDASLPAPVDDPAIRDANEIAMRVEADEAAAARARDQYRRHGLPELVVDDAPKLQAGERIHATRHMALVERSSAAGAPAGPASGALWLTSARILHDGPSRTVVAVDAVDEMTISMSRLLLIRLRDGSGLTIETDQPRLLRVQIAAALEALRA